MANLYAYGLKPKPRSLKADIDLGDLSGVALGPDLFSIVAEALKRDGHPYEVPAGPDPDHKDLRTLYLEVTPEQIEVDAAERLIFGRIWVHRRGEAERKTDVATGTPKQYSDGDLGDRPLFFLLSIPKDESEMLVILEAARPYGMATIWRTQLKKLITEAIPDGVHIIETPNGVAGRDVVLKWGAYGALETPDFIEQHLDGLVDEASASVTIAHGDEPDERRVVGVARKQKVDRSALAELFRGKKRKEVAEMLIPVGMVEGLSNEPDEVSFTGRFEGREMKISMSRETVSQPGLPVPGGLDKDPHYVVVSAMRSLAASMAELVGHGHTWE